jgi:type I restriction enzyme S subunit
VVPLPDKGYARHFQFLEKSAMPLPPLAEQQRIVAKIEELFTKLDAGVGALKKIKAQLKRYRQAVLKYAFEGKLTEEWRAAHKGELEPASAVLERIKKERGENAIVGARAPRSVLLERIRKGRGDRPVAPTVVDRSDLPELPEGWVWTTFGQLVFDSQNGLSKRQSNHGATTHVLRLADILNGRISPATPRDILLTDDEVSKYGLHPGDLLCIRVNGSANLVGRMITFSEKQTWAFCDHFIRFRPLQQFVSPSFLHYFFNTQVARRHIEFGMVSSAGQNTVSQTTMNAAPVPYTHPLEQSKIVNEIERRFSIADEAEKVVEQSLKQAERLRQSILKKAFEGRLVSQDPSDEPAEKLLERIRQAKVGAGFKPAPTVTNKRHRQRR